MHCGSKSSSPSEARRPSPSWETDSAAFRCLLINHSELAQFLGAGLDTGATRTVIGLGQAKAYAKLSSQPLKLDRVKPTNFLFGGVATPSLGTVEIRAPIPSHLHACFRVDVVNLDVPFLLGLYILDELALHVNNVTNELKCHHRGIATPLVRMNNHIYLPWGEQAYYTTVELYRLHRHFNHPHPDRLSALLRRAGDPSATPDTRKQLERLSPTSDVCQRLSRAPGRFRVALPPDEVTFNRVVLVDLMYLDGRSVMHIVGKETLFSAAAFTKGERLEDLWRLYSAAWAQAYAGHPQVVHVDQAPQFTSPTWQGLRNSARFELVKSGVESHNALGAGERYNAYLQTIYRKVRLGHPGIDQETALSTAVAAMNQTTGPRGLAPTLLVFGILPRTPVSTLPLPTQTDRMQAIVDARREMQALVACARLRTALSAPVPAAASRDLHHVDHVLVYREPPQDKWVGPHFAAGVQDKVVWLAVDGVLRQYSVDKVKKYKPPVTADKGRTPAPVEGPMATSAPSREDGTTTDGAPAETRSDLTTGGLSSPSGAPPSSPSPGLEPRTTTNVANDIAPRPPPEPDPTAAAVAG